jgi:hypothetical protein
VTTRRLAALVALAALGLAACGKYGPPVRSKPQAVPAAPAEIEPISPEEEEEQSE